MKQKIKQGLVGGISIAVAVSLLAQTFIKNNSVQASDVFSDVREIKIENGYQIAELVNQRSEFPTVYDEDGNFVLNLKDNIIIGDEEIAYMVGGQEPYSVFLEQLALASWRLNDVKIDAEGNKIDGEATVIKNQFEFLCGELKRKNLLSEELFVTPITLVKGSILHQLDYEIYRNTSTFLEVSSLDLDQIIPEEIIYDDETTEMVYGYLVPAENGIYEWDAENNRVVYIGGIDATSKFIPGINDISPEQSTQSFGTTAEEYYWGDEDDYEYEEFYEDYDEDPYEEYTNYSDTYDDPQGGFLEDEDEISNNSVEVIIGESQPETEELQSESLEIIYLPNQTAVETQYIQQLTRFSASFGENDNGKRYNFYTAQEVKEHNGLNQQGFVGYIDIDRADIIAVTDSEADAAILKALKSFRTVMLQNNEWFKQEIFGIPNEVLDENDSTMVHISKVPVYVYSVTTTPIATTNGQSESNLAVVNGEFPGLDSINLLYLNGVPNNDITMTLGQKIVDRIANNHMACIVNDATTFIRLPSLGVNGSITSRFQSLLYMLYQGDIKESWKTENGLLYFEKEQLSLTVDENNRLNVSDNGAHFVRKNVYVTNEPLTTPYLSNLIPDLGNGFDEVSYKIELENYQREQDIYGSSNTNQDFELITGVTKALSIQYIITYREGGISLQKSKIKVLELEPCYDFTYAPMTFLPDVNGRSDADKIKLFKKDFFDNEDYDIDVEIVGMTTAEFCGKIDDLNEEYDLIYWGSNISAMNFGTAMDGSNERYTLHNDTAMDGMVYTHIGDTNIAAGDTDGYNLKDILQGGYAEEFRYSGNDILSNQKEKLKSYLDAGYPIVVADDFFTEDAAIDNDYSASNINSSDVIVGSILLDKKDTQVSYYSFDNVNDGELLDEWGNRNGTIDASATTAEGMSGNALWVTQEGKGATISTRVSGLDNNDWTISFWVKTTSEFNKEISVLEDSAREYSLSLKMAAGKNSGFRVGDPDNMVLTSAYDFVKDKWYHLTWTQKKSEGYTLYVNGTKVRDVNSYTKDNSIRIPADVIGGNGFTGLIDEVKIYNRVLGESEILSVMNGGEIDVETVTTEIHGILDTSSYVYQFVNSIVDARDKRDKNSNLYNNFMTLSQVKREDKKKDFAYAINQPKIAINVVSRPIDYSYTERVDASGVSVIDSANYLIKANDGKYYLEYEFYISNATDISAMSTRYQVNLYVDENMDGRFTNNENLSLSKVTDLDHNTTIDTNQLQNGTYYNVKRQLPDGYLGSVPWKLVITDVNNGNIRGGVSGISAVKEEKKDLYILQLVQDRNNATYKYQFLGDNEVPHLVPKDGAWVEENFEARSDQWTALLEAVPDFNVHITAIDVEDYLKTNKPLSDEELIKKYSYDYKGKHYEFDPSLNSYDMLLLGYTDSYLQDAGGNAFNNAKNIGRIMEFMQSGKSILFTHDFVNRFNHKDNSNSLNMLTRDIAGQDRFGITIGRGTYDGVDSEYTAKYANNIPSKYEEVTSANLKDTIFGAEGLNGYTRDIAYKPGTGQTVMARETQGVTYTGWESPITTSRLNKSWTIQNYFYLGYGETRQGDHVRSDYGNKYYGSQGLNVQADSGLSYYGTDLVPDKVKSVVGKVNEGAITKYPYVLPDEINIDYTHAQYYQLDLESDGDGDKEGDIVVWYTINNSLEDKYDVFNMSPYDVRNNYYVYNKGNITYTGMGQSPIKNETEIKLFINTMIASYRVSTQAPEVRTVNNPEDRKPKKFDKIPYDDDVDSSKDIYPVFFQIADTNLVNENQKQIYCKIYMEDKAGNQILEIGGKEHLVKEISEDKRFSIGQGETGSVQLGAYTEFGYKIESNTVYRLDVPLSLLSTYDSINLFIEGKAFVTKNNKLTESPSLYTDFTISKLQLFNMD